MPIRKLLVETIRERYGDRQVELFEGGERGPVARFRGAHPDVGDLQVDAGPHGVDVAIVTIIHDTFHSYDLHLDEAERDRRVVRDVVRFLDELFADRLLFWRGADGRGAGWRERGVTGSLDPLVLDNRVYRVYLWSGPLGEWQAIPVILGRGRVQNDREYEILRIQLAGEGVAPVDAETGARIRELVEKYEATRE